MKKVLKVLATASLLLTIATSAVMTASASDVSRAAVPQTKAWGVSVSPMGYYENTVYVKAVGSTCSIQCTSYSSTPDARPIYFSSPDGYDKVTITGSGQSRYINYVAGADQKTSVQVKYNCSASTSRVTASGNVVG